MRRYCFLFLLLGFCVSASYAELISPIEVYVGQDTTLTLRITNTGNVPLEALSARIESKKVPQWLKQTSPEVVKSTQPQQVAHLPLRLSISRLASIGFLQIVPVIITDGHGRSWPLEIPLTLADVIPKENQLYPNYPNPFNPETWIPYQLKAPAFVTIRIYNPNGVLVRTLNVGHKVAGTYLNKSRAAYWDGKNDHGEKVASGLYFYAMNAGSFTAVRKLVILK